MAEFESVEVIEPVQDERLHIPVSEGFFDGKKKQLVLRLECLISHRKIVQDLAQVVLRNGLGVANPLLVDWKEENSQRRCLLVGDKDTEPFKVTVAKLESYGVEGKLTILGGGDFSVSFRRRLTLIDYDLSEDLYAWYQLDRELAYSATSKCDIYNGREEITIDALRAPSVGALKLYLRDLQSRQGQNTEAGLEAARPVAIKPKRFKIPKGGFAYRNGRFIPTEELED